jgi:hypothetical protein
MRVPKDYSEPLDAHGRRVRVGDRVRKIARALGPDEPPTIGQVVGVRGARIEVFHLDGKVWRSAAFLWEVTT